MQAAGSRLGTVECRIGEWTFFPEGNELRRGTERRRLEHRASRTLELLYRRRGEIVSQEDILADVWNGRTISPNSVPVVIKDIRQALGDAAREPRHIETVSKRGYRLLLDTPEPHPATRQSERLASRRRGPVLVMAVMLGLLALVSTAIASFGLGDREAVRLIVADVENATGNPSFQPLATATGELIEANALKLEGVYVIRGGKAQAPKDAVTLSTRLILWEGRPTAMLSARNAAGVTIWTAMTSGFEARVPGDVSVAIKDLGQTMQRAPRS